METTKTMKTFDTDKARKVLERVEKFLGILIRENLVKDAPFLDEGELENESDLADDVWEVLQMKPRNCDRFATETDAQIAFLNEVWLIGVSKLDRDPFDGWTNEMKSAYSKWLFAPATEKEKVELTPCKECGHSALLRLDDLGWYVRCEVDFCDNCTEYFDTPEEASRVWNQRQERGDNGNT
jgi:hypothetical protein